MAKRGFDWDADDRWAKVRAWREAGETAGACAKLIGHGCTSNMIIGREHRMGMHHGRPPITGAPWTPQQIATLRTCLADGATNEKAAELTGRTVRSVIEKVIALKKGGARRTPRIGQGSERRQWVPKPSKPKPVLPLVELSPPRPTSAQPQLGQIAPDMWKFDQLRQSVPYGPDHRDCCWLMNNSKPWLVCAAPRLLDRPYCAFHCAASVFQRKAA